MDSSIYKKNQQIALNQSLASNFSSSSYTQSEIKEIRSYCIFALVTSASGLSGTLSLQASPDGQNWAAIPNTSQTLTGVNGNANYLLFDPNPFQAYPYVQLVWTQSAGSGTLNAFLSCKQ